MKIVEILGGLRIPLNNEENTLFEKVKKQDAPRISDLNDREKEVLRSLFKKNVVNIDEGKITYNALQDSGAIW